MTNASGESRARGATPQALLAALPSATHKKAFLVAVEAVLAGQSGICLTGGSTSDRAAFVDQLAAALPATQVVVARLGLAASPDDVHVMLEAAGRQRARLTHVLLAVSDADALRHDTLGQLNTIAGYLLTKRQGLQLLLAGSPRLLDRLRAIQHENMLRYLEIRLKLPALTVDAPRSSVPGAEGLPARPSEARTVLSAERSPSLAPARSRRPDWVTGASVVAASALLAAGGLTLAIRRTAPDLGAAIAAPNRFAAIEMPQPAIAPAAVISDAPRPAVRPATRSAPPLPAQPASAMAVTSPEPAPALASTSPAPAAIALASLAPNPAPQQAPNPDTRAEASRPAGPGLMLIAAHGDTLARLYQRIYAGAPPPPFATVQAVNRGPVQPGARLLFPAPPGGWPGRASGAGLPQGAVRRQ